MNPIYIPLVLIGGWLLGTALVYITDTLAMTRKLAAPQCIHCQARRSFSDLLLMRPCPECNTRQRRKVWMVPLLSMAAVVVLWAAPPLRLPFWPALVLFFYFAVVLIMDLEYRVILHPVSITGAVLGLIFGTWFFGGSSGVWLRGFLISIGGGAAGFALMYGLYWGGEMFRRFLSRIRGQSIEEEALGFGDVNFSGVLGLMVGFPGIILVLLGAIALGGLFSGIYILILAIQKRYHAFTAIPYAPFLVLAGVTMFYLIPAK